MVGWMVWLAVAQTSPLAYVGIDQVGRYLSSSGTQTDSIFFPNQSVSTVPVIDSMIAVADTTINGAPGKVLYSFSQSDTASVDTLLVWEVGDTVMAFYPIGDTAFPIAYYLAPMSSGLTWSMGLPSFILEDVVGDTTADSIYVENDSVQILGQESVSVPLGSFTAYHLVRTISALVVTANPGSFDPESTTVFTEMHEWMVPNIGPVKDSSYTEDSIKIFGSWILMSKTFRSTEAYDRGLPVEERTRPHPTGPSLVVEGGRFSLEGVAVGSWVEIVDALGRRHAKGVARLSRYQGVLPEGRGLYWIRVRQPDGSVYTLKVVRLR